MPASVVTIHPVRAPIRLQRFSFGVFLPFGIYEKSIFLPVISIKTA